MSSRREWIGLAVLTIACLLYAMDLTVLHLAVPSLSADLETSSAQLLWIVDIYGFMVAGFLVTMGTLGDRIGRRRLLMIGAAAFAAVSVLAAFSTSPEMLIASRALQGIAGATLAPATLSLIFNMFLDPRQRTIAIGVWIAGFSAGRSPARDWPLPSDLWDRCRRSTAPFVVRVDARTPVPRRREGTMSDFLLLYQGGSMPETEEAQKQVMEAWTAGSRVLARP